MMAFKGLKIVGIVALLRKSLRPIINSNCVGSDGRATYLTDYNDISQVESCIPRLQ